MRDNDSTSPDIIQIRQKAGRFQNDLNLALGIAGPVSASSGGTGASVGGAIGAGGGVTSIVGGGSGSGGDDGGDLGGRCFGGDTLVTMADGPEKPIRETKLFSDVVMVPVVGGRVEHGRIIHRTETIYTDWLRVTFEDGRVVDVRPEHRYRTVGGDFVAIRDLQHVIHLNSEKKWEVMEITKKETLSGEMDFYNLGVEHTAKAYIAAGDWVSNIKPLDAFET
jgi:hypothetical protein